MTTESTPSSSWRVNDSQGRRRQALDALGRLSEDGQEITVWAVARAALLTELKRKSSHVNGYLAVSGATVGVYPDEAIQSHLAFLSRRRAIGPTDEYRVPTHGEWQESLGHFELRKFSTGICGPRGRHTMCPRTQPTSACTGRIPPNANALPKSATI
jgi:hypothetical protein